MSQRWRAAAPSVWWWCEGCGLRYFAPVRIIEQGKTCPECNCSSWSRLPGGAGFAPLRELERRRKEGRA